MTEPMIEESEAEALQFIEELSDEALDRVEETRSGCSNMRCRGPIA
jgi:hypothetical protein